MDRNIFGDLECWNIGIPGFLKGTLIHYSNTQLFQNVIKE